MQAFFRALNKLYNALYKLCKSCTRLGGRIRRALWEVWVLVIMMYSWLMPPPPSPTRVYYVTKRKVFTYAQDEFFGETGCHLSSHIPNQRSNHVTYKTENDNLNILVGFNFPQPTEQDIIRVNVLLSTEEQSYGTVYRLF